MAGDGVPDPTAKGTVHAGADPARDGSDPVGERHLGWWWCVLSDRRTLLLDVDQWNLASKKGYDVSFTWALAPYVTGSDAEDVLRTIDRKMYSKKHNLVPVFSPASRRRPTPTPCTSGLASN